MNYHILNPDGDRIASFEHECDRDVCLNAFEDFYGPDCEFTVEDDEDGE